MAAALYGRVRRSSGWTAATHWWTSSPTGGARGRFRWNCAGRSNEVIFVTNEKIWQEATMRRVIPLLCMLAFGAQAQPAPPPSGAQPPANPADQLVGLFGATCLHFA